MAQPVTVRKVESRADYRPFFAFPWMVYKDDPNWVPPLLSMRHETLDKKKNPAWEYMEGDYFTAWRGSSIVGTIAAFVNHRHNEFHQENIGWFGFFEAYNDSEVAQALLDTAAEWVRSRQYDAIRGPQSFTTHEETGLLIDGFERPVMLMPYHHRYYRQLIEGAGFQKVMDYYSLYLNYREASRPGSRNMERMQKLVERIMRRGNIAVRDINRKKLKDEFALVKEIYNSAWDRNYGFTPMTEKELDALVKSLSIFFDPDLASIVEVDGEAVGFMLGVPDFNAVLHKVYPRPGVPEIFSLLKAVWHWKIRPCITDFRIPLLGIKEGHRKKGLDVLMYHHLSQVLNKPGSPYKGIDGGWVLEINQDLLGTLKSAGMEIYRTYRMYERRFRD